MHETIQERTSLIVLMHGTSQSSEPTTYKYAEVGFVAKA